MTAVTKMATLAHLTEVNFSLKRKYEYITMKTELMDTIAPTIPPFRPA
jgi:hypothetical protein